MARTVLFHSLFETDVREAATWYEERQNGLGGLFRERVESRILAVVSDPSRGSTASDDLLYSKIKRFPYLLLYSVSDSTLHFVGLLHTARSGERWISDRSREA